MKLKPAYFLPALGLGLIIFTAQVFVPKSVDPAQDAAVLKGLFVKLNRFHYQPRTLDDKFSEQVYDRYMDDIDNGRRFLTQEDVSKLEAFKKNLDDQANTASFEFFDLSDNLMDAALPKTQGYYQEILATPLDFSKDETIEMKGEKRGFSKNDAELKAYWTQLMKYEVITRLQQKVDEQEKADFKGEKKSTETLEKDARKAVLDVYDKWYKRMMKMERNDRFEVYLNAITGVYDPHTSYFAPKDKENFDIQMSGKLEGIGARLQSDGEKTTVTEIVPGSPSWKQGELEAKDIILKVGQANDEPVDIQGMDIDDVVSKIRGKKGSEVRLTFQKTDGTIKTITLIRDVVIMEEGFAKSLILYGQDKTEKIGYIKLPKFYADFTAQGSTSCAVDVAKEIEKLKSENVKGIVLDLRNNGGGSLRDVVQMGGLFIEQGPIVQVKSRTGRPDVMEDVDSRVQWAGPFIIMQNGFSASASEILTAAMQDYDRAIIVGSKSSFGKGTVQRFYPIDDTQSKPYGDVKITMQKFFRIDGGSTQLRGVTPDIILPDSYNEIETGEREEKSALAWTDIEPSQYSQNVYHAANMAKIKSASAERVKKNETMQLINSNASRLKKREAQTSMPLGMKTFQAYNKKLKTEGEQFDDMYKTIDAFQFDNPTADLTHIQSDTSRIARNEDWLKNVKKDVQLFETVQIMRDLIRLDGVAQKN
jgi:carboxyl-terminal processing protease